MNPFSSLLRLSVGEFAARTLSFLGFAYAARVLGVEQYGVLEFALSLMTYLLLVADGGLELWATRAAAQGESLPGLAGRIVPLRLLLAVAAYLVLLAITAVVPDYPSLRLVLLLFGLTLFAQALNLKWVFMGRERMTDVAAGLVASQLVFAIALLVTVHSGAGLVWIPVIRLVADSVTAAYFAFLYRRKYGALTTSFNLTEARQILRRAIVLGAAHGLAQVSYNFDSVLLGLLSGSAAVGLYNAAYRLISALLALPVSYFLGLFPVLSRTFRSDLPEFQAIIRSSLRLLAVFALPIGMAGTLWARPVIQAVFGASYAGAVLPLQILSWSATLVILRGTYRQALNASGRQDLDFRCAWIATAVNVVLNLQLIPRFDIAGAAIATLSSEVVWLAMASITVYRKVTPVSLAPALRTPLQAVGLAALAAWLMNPFWWIYQILVAGLTYLGAISLLGEPLFGSSRRGKLQHSS